MTTIGLPQRLRPFLMLETPPPSLSESEILAALMEYKIVSSTYFARLFRTDLQLRLPVDYLACHRESEEVSCNRLCSSALSSFRYNGSDGKRYDCK